MSHHKKSHLLCDSNQHEAAAAWLITLRGGEGLGGAKPTMDVSSQVTTLERGEDCFEPDLNVHI